MCRRETVRSIELSFAQHFYTNFTTSNFELCKRVGYCPAGGSIKGNNGRMYVDWGNNRGETTSQNGARERSRDHRAWLSVAGSGDGVTRQSLPPLLPTSEDGIRHHMLVLPWE